VPRQLRSRSIVGRAPRRSTIWGPMNFGRVNAIAADGAVTFGFGFIPTTTGQTIVRMRGELLVAGTMSSGDSAELAVGIGITSFEAFAVGITALPSPIVDANWPNWIYHRWCSVISIAQSIELRTQNFRFEIDNKAMRKLQPGQIVFAIVEMDNEQGTGVTVDLMCNVRTLVKLS